jgi:hypothetical protein
MRMGKALTVGLSALQGFIGLGAVGGGLVLIWQPSGATLGIPLEELENSPFSTYLIPGIVLLAVNGMGNILGAGATVARQTYAGHIAIVLGGFLVAWITFQVYWFTSIHWLHALYFILGILELVLGLALLRASRRGLG